MARNEAAEHDEARKQDAEGRAELGVLRQQQKELGYRIRQDGRRGGCQLLELKPRVVGAAFLTAASAVLERTQRTLATAAAEERKAAEAAWRESEAVAAAKECEATAKAQRDAVMADKAAAVAEAEAAKALVCGRQVKGALPRYPRKDFKAVKSLLDDREAQIAALREAGERM